MDIVGKMWRGNVVIVVGTIQLHMAVVQSGRKQWYSKVRAAKNLSYAEAVKVVNKESKEEQSERETREATVSSERLVLFIACVINCADQVKTDRIKIIVKAAAGFLNMGYLSWERIQADLIGETREPSQLESAHH